MKKIILPTAVILFYALAPMTFGQDTDAVEPDVQPDAVAEQPTTPPAPKPHDPAQEPTSEADSVVQNFYLDIPVRPGDTIHVAMREDEEVIFDGVVSPAGVILLPHLGRFVIAGKTEKEAEEELEQAFRKELYEKATITVAVIKSAPGRVYVYGAVKTPGRIELPEFGEKRILQVVAEAGGVTRWASVDGAYVLRMIPGKHSRDKITVDLGEAFTDLGAGQNLVMHNNDVIFIPSVTGFDSILSSAQVEVVVTGQVVQPGMVAFEPGERRTFLRALLKAGSFTRFARKNAVRLIRYGNDGTRTVTTVDAEAIIDEGFLEKDIELQAGDLIIVDEKMLNF